MMRTFLVAAFTIVLAFPAHAGGDESDGHSHGPAPSTASAGTATPRLESVTEELQLVATAKGRVLTVYLDAFATNEPIDGATIEVVADDKEKATVKPLGDGVYEVEAEWLDAPGVKSLIFTVTTPTVTDLLNGTLNIHGPAEAAPPAPLAFTGLAVRPEVWVWTAIAAALGFFLAFAFRPARIPPDDAGAAAAVRPQERAEPAAKTGLRKAAALLLFLTAPLLWDQPSHAGGDESDGHSHAPAQSEAAPLGDVPRRLADGSAFVPKPSQRLLRIRTIIATPASAPQAQELLGSVLPDPSFSGRVQAAFAGRIEVPASGLAFVGQKVSAGDILAVVAPTVTFVERGAVGQQIAEIDGGIEIAEQKVARLKKLVGSVPQREIDEAKAELDALRERRAALAPSLGGREELRAPVSGVISAANVRAGQAVDAREVLFEIVNPEKIWVEAVGFDQRDPEAIASAFAIAGKGESVPLSYLGRAPALRQQSQPVLFRVESPTPGLAIGRTVTVVVQAKTEARGIVLPEAAIVSADNGLPQVWTQVAAEQFAPVAVRSAPLDGKRILVTAGLDAGVRVVTEGAEFINQIR